MKVLVTGASGFIGRHLVPQLTRQGHSVVAVTRKPGLGLATEELLVGDLGDITCEHLADVNAVVNLAGIAHSRAHPQPTHDRVNCEAVVALAREARDSGVTCFVQLSTSKVYGDRSDDLITPRSPVRPIGPYAVSKARADELLLSEMASQSMGVVSLQPPVVYGAGVKGNLAMLSSTIRSGRPIPVSSRPNRRSLLSVDALCEAIGLVLAGPTVGVRRFTLADDLPLSTADVVAALGTAVGRKPRTVTVPRGVLLGLARIERSVGQPARAAPLAYDFVVGSEDFRQSCNWTGVSDTRQRLRAVAEPSEKAR